MKRSVVHISSFVILLFIHTGNYPPPWYRKYEMDGPLTCKLVTNLNSVEKGLNPSSLRFTNITMESDKYVCIRDMVKDPSGAETPSIVIVELASDQRNKNSTRHGMAATDAAIMNPAQKILALRAGRDIQVFDLEMKDKLKTTSMTEDVVFMKWISQHQMALITNTAVYHWSIHGNDPVKMFSRSQSCTVLNYKTDPACQWLLLIGIANDASRKGIVELYSVEKDANKPIDGHAACFCKFKPPGAVEAINLMCIANGDAGGTCFIAEVPPPNQKPSFERVNVQIPVSEAGDFPVGMHANDEQGLLYVLCRSGWLFLLDVQTGTMIHKEKISQSPEPDNVFVTTKCSTTGGMYAINTKGEVRHVAVNATAIVPWIQQRLGNQNLALRVAASGNLGGADELFIQRFNALLQSMQIDAAVALCCEAPNHMLRTREVLQRFQSMPSPQGSQPPQTIYFKYMIEHSTLNSHESVGLARVMLSKQGGIDFVKQYLEDKKLEESEELGDIVREADHPDLALQIYYKGKAHWKVVFILVQKQQWAGIIKYVKSEDSWNPDWTELLDKVCQACPHNHQGVSDLAELVAQDADIADLDHNRVIEMFMAKSAFRPATGYLLEVLKEDKPEQAQLQTRLLEINLMYSPPTVANEILTRGIVSHYDALKVAELCEQAKLHQRALENYNKVQQDSEYRDSTISQLKRVIVNTQSINQEWLVEFFQQLSKPDAIECITELMSNNQSVNYKTCVQIAIKNYEVLGTDALIELFLNFRAFEALYYFLGNIIRASPAHPEGCTDPEVHYRYLEAAANVGQISEVERMTRESDYYPAEKTKNFLKEKRLQDLWPLINVCDKHDFMDEMVRFLYDTKALAYVDQFIQKKDPKKTPFVVGSLLDVGCNEDYISKLIVSVGSMVPVNELVEEVEKRNRLKLLQDWLESRLHVTQEQGVYNALAKIYVDTNKNAKQFLTDNVGKYDPVIVGKYCENRDPNLAVLSYEQGQCDAELIDVTSRNGMFKHQSRYLVTRMDKDLWATVLEGPTYEQYRKNLIDAVVATALPEAKKAEEVSAAVKAFMAADLPEHLTALLEKIILHGTEFKNNRYLQNLLILTAIKSTPQKVMDYVQKLDKYDAKDIAEIASKAELYEEAFTIYKKQGMHTQATQVLLQDIQNLDRARDFAEKAGAPEIWAAVGRAELTQGDITMAVASFIKAEDATQASSVINAVKACGQKEKYTDLVKFLQMARSGHKQKDEVIDTELCYAFCVTSRITDLEEFLKGSNLAKVADVGERCYNEELFEAAKLCFTTVSNFPFLAKTHMKLGQFEPAIAAAQRANSVPTWKEVCYACVEAEEYRLAASAAQHVIVVADELQGVIEFFEGRGKIDELISLLKQGLTSERAHVGMFTELAILYAKYRHEKLMEHIKLWKNRLNAHKLVVVCEEYHHWAEIRYIHCKNEEWDSAARVMVDHSVLSWDHEIFKDTISRVSSLELCYSAIGFYLEEHPDLVNDLLTTIIKRVDPDKVVQEVQNKSRTGPIDFMSVIRPYLETAQEGDHKKVNNALNRLYIEEEDFESLRSSVENFQAIDQVELADELHVHDLLEMRRVGSWLYKMNGKYRQAIEISKKDKLYQDAMQTAADSGDKEVVSDLIRFFTDNKLHECFSAALYTCYDYIQPDVALELAWRHKVYDFAMPYIIQVLKEYIDKIDDVSSQLADAKQQAEAQFTGAAPQSQQSNLMISNAPTGYPQQSYQTGGYSGY